MTEHTETRAQIVQACRDLAQQGLNRGASGNIAVRAGDGLLITPSGIASNDLTPAMIVPLDADGTAAEGGMEPSTEWRFHHDLLTARPDLGAVVHTHAPFCTILSIARRPIPAVHYMIAAFGGPDIRVADYATFGTQALSDHVIQAMHGRNGCLMANHGMLVAGPDLKRALWLAGELEALAHQYYHALVIGQPHILSETEVSDAAARFASYGPQGAV